VIRDINEAEYTTNCIARGWHGSHESYVTGSAEWDWSKALFLISIVVVFIFEQQFCILGIKYSDQRSESFCKRITTTISIVMSSFNIISVTNNHCQFSPNGKNVACCFANKLTIRNTSTLQLRHTFFCIDDIDVSTCCSIY
jgi:hypothetical protein